MIKKRKRKSWKREKSRERERSKTGRGIKEEQKNLHSPDRWSS